MNPTITVKLTVSNMSEGLRDATVKRINERIAALPAETRQRFVETSHTAYHEQNDYPCYEGEDFLGAEVDEEIENILDDIINDQLEQEYAKMPEWQRDAWNRPIMMDKWVGIDQ